MKASEYLTRPELGLSKAQVECVTQLASICGIDSMFEALKVGGKTGAVAVKSLGETGVGKTLREEKKKQEENERKKAEKARKEKEKREAKGIYDEPADKKKKIDFGDLYSDVAEEDEADTVLYGQNLGRAAELDDDTNGIDAFDRASDIAFKDMAAFSDPSKEEGDDVESVDDSKAAFGVVSDLVNTIAKINGHDQVMDINEYLENDNKAKTYVNGYIEDMANNIRIGTGRSLGARLTGDEDNVVNEVTAQKLKRQLEAYRMSYFADHPEDSVAQSIEVIQEELDKFLTPSTITNDQSFVDKQTLDSVLGGTSSGRANELMDKKKQDTLNKVFRRKQASLSGL